MSATREPIRPGEIAPRSGQYREIRPRGGVGREVTVVKGEPLPPATAPNRTYTGGLDEEPVGLGRVATSMRAS
jgi:hypothetical protein